MTAQPKNGFQFYLQKQNHIGKGSHKDSPKSLIQKETKNIREFCATKFVDYQMKQ